MSGWPCCRPAAVVDSTRAVASGGRPRGLAYRLGMPEGTKEAFPIRSAEEACGGARAYGGCEAGAKRNGHRRGVPTTRAHVRATPSIMIAGVRAFRVGYL